MPIHDTPLPDTKTCTKCGETKPMADFPRRAGARDGHENRCKRCKALAYSEWRKAHPESVAASQKAWREGNRSARREYNATYHAAHMDQIRRRQTAKYAENRDEYLRRATDYRAANREIIRAKKKAYVESNSDHVTQLRAMVRLRVRREAMAHYGGATPACACCGETTPGFLTIDHIGGGGNAHRREIGQMNLCQWLKRNGYPEGFRVLCFNCNWADGIYGRCPHVDSTAGDFTQVTPRWKRVLRSQPVTEPAPLPSPDQVQGEAVG